MCFCTTHHFRVSAGNRAGNNPKYSLILLTEELFKVGKNKTYLSFTCPAKDLLIVIRGRVDFPAL